MITTRCTVRAPVEDVWTSLVDLDGHRSWNPFIRVASGTVDVAQRPELTMQDAQGATAGSGGRTLLQQAGTFTGAAGARHPRATLAPTRAGFEAMSAALAQRAVEHARPNEWSSRPDP